MAQIRLTDEDRQKLRGLIPFNPDTILKCTPKIYKDLELSVNPVFLLKPLTRGEYESTDGNGEQLAEMTLRHIVGWENIFDIETLEPLAFSEETKSALHSTVILQIFERLASEAGLFDVEKRSFD